MHLVHMVKDSYDIKNNSRVKMRYPALFEEVSRHDKESDDDSYHLSTKAFCEYKRYVNDRDIGYLS
jgi:hypothetical protein